MEWLVQSLAILGLAVLLYFVIAFASQIVTAVRTHLTVNTLPFTTRYGKWAVITGSTDGIGRAYAFELAKRGVNIFLISRTQEKLDRTAEEIQRTFLVGTKTIAADFSKGRDVFEKIEEQLKGIEIGILVNNVGKQYDYPMYLTEVPEEQLWEIININIGATTQMTRLILPQMLSRGKGAIVNVSSASELQPLPLMTVYAASKTFIQSFSSALRCEYEKQGITVQHLFPLFVNTKMNNFSERLRKSTIFVPDAETYAAGAVNALGRTDILSGCFSHDIQAIFINAAPIKWRTYIGWTLNEIFRTDYNKKLE